MINLKNISLTYGTNSVLHDLSLDIESNKLTCLLGGSGSGKTTILRLIAGLETPQEGTIIIDNTLMTNENEIVVPPHLREVGFVFQDLALWPHFTVYKNIAFSLEERISVNIKEEVMQMLRFFNLEEYADKFPHQLSGGQQQLVAISRSLVLKPKILLMDEPLANLDVKLKRKILEHIKKMIHDFNLTIVYVTHDHKEAFAIADKIIVLNDGKIEESGSIEKIKKSDNNFVKYFLEY